MFIFAKRSFDRQARYAVIGDPIAHSMSPEIHNASFEALGLDECYHAIRIRKGDLKCDVRTLVDKGYKGFNVTIPHKVAMLDIVDEIDPLAERIGAINTVVVKEGKMFGYNTDGTGFLRGVEAFYRADLKSADVVLIGAGGAARAIATTLYERGVGRLTIANRTIAKAETLLSACRLDGEVVSLDECEAGLGMYDLIINTTPIGMEPDTVEKPVRLDHVRRRSYVCDIIYNPLQTEWLKDAENRGCFIQNGIPMFVHQAALSFAHWTGSMPDIERMERTAIGQLGRRGTV